MAPSAKHSTEHARAWRAEALGVALAIIGCAFLFLAKTREGMFAGVAVIGIGALVVSRTASHYAHARANVKASAARPAPVLANPRV